MSEPDLIDLSTLIDMGELRHVQDRLMHECNGRHLDLLRAYKDYTEQRAEAGDRIQQSDLDAALNLFAESLAKSQRDLDEYEKVVDKLVGLLASNAPEAAPVAPAALTWPELLKRTFAASSELPAVSYEDARADERRGLAIWMNLGVRPRLPRTPQTPPTREVDDEEDDDA